MKKKTIGLCHLALVPVFLFSMALGHAEACSRLLYKTGNGTYITARSMDWNDPDLTTSLWVFPQGMKRNGGDGKNALTWTSKYGSVISSFYDTATADGMNEKGLVGNLQYLSESDYGDPAKTGKQTLSIGAWLQYFLDSYATVEEAVAAMKDSPFTILAPKLANGLSATIHMALSDPTGDSAILEYLDGELVIHHGPQHVVMTNSPIYSDQLALNAYWDKIGGDKFLPGTGSAADRYVRLSYFLKTVENYEDPKKALATAFSLIRGVSVPIGMTSASRPMSPETLWRTVADHDTKIYYFDSALFPSVFWVDLNKVDLKPGAKVKTLAISKDNPLAGEVSSQLKEAKPFEWLKGE